MSAESTSPAIETFESNHNLDLTEELGDVDHEACGISCIGTAD